MAFNMNVWKVEDNTLKELPKSRLDSEDRLENWIAADSSITGLDLLVIGKQVVTLYGGRIDLLAMDYEGNLVILELKRDRTPRDVVSQTLDYASWVKDLTYEQVDAIATNYLQRKLSDAFFNRFGVDLPQEINRQHSMIIVASELDPSSERIVQYLSSQYNININCIFFDFFKEKDQEFLGRSWLMDPEEVSERTKPSKSASPWTGIYYVNVGDGEHRSWEDCKTYGFLSAGQGKKYRDAIQKLNVGDKVMAYLKGKGYVGFGEVISPARMVKDFTLPDETKLLDHRLVQPNISNNQDDPELADWTVGVKWLHSIDRDSAVTFTGIFSNQNVVCKLKHKPTIDHLAKYFPINSY